MVGDSVSLVWDPGGPSERRSVPFQTRGTRHGLWQHPLTASDDDDNSFRPWVCLILWLLVLVVGTVPELDCVVGYCVETEDC